MFVHEYFNECKIHIATRVSSLKHEEILSKNPEEWIDELTENRSIPFIEEASPPMHDYATIREGIRDYGRMTYIEAVYLVVEWQLVDHSKLRQTLELKPNPHNPFLPQINYKNGCIKFKIRVGVTTELDKPHVQERATTELSKAIDGVRNEFRIRNEQIERYISELRRFTEDIVKRRIEEVEKKEIALKQISEKIQIPLKKKSEDIKVVKINPQKNIAETRKVKKTLPSGKLKEYILDRDDFIKFIGYIDRYMRSCERTPIPFYKLEEEHIRDLMLPYLNQVFTKGVTGETFSKFGKTDIYLTVDEGCILICECKWWRGPTSLFEAMKQVLDRVTWRENYGIVLIFARGDISQILDKAKGAIKGHESNISQAVQEIQNHHFCSKNLRPDDRDKTVEIHYLFYNFPKK